MHPKSVSSHSEEESYFEAKRGALDEGEPGGGSHGTEMGWLVSYADMMTLLFGLFVILFTLATIQPKNVDEVMKQVSKKYFIHNGDEPVPAGPKDEPPVNTQKEEVQALKVSMESQQKEFDKKVSDLETKIKEIEEQRDAAVKKMQQAEARVKKADKPKEDPGSGKDEAQTVSDLQTKAQATESTVEQQKSEIKSLENQLASLKKDLNDAKRFFALMIIWKNRDSDVDLEVKDPHGGKYNFKNRSGQGGQFVLDSKSGPGMELWQSDHVMPGKYQLKVTLYKAQENEKTTVDIIGLTKLSQQKVQTITLNTKTTKQVINLEVLEGGEIKLSP